MILVTLVVIKIMVLVNWLPCATTSLSPPLVMEMMTDALLLETLQAGTTDYPALHCVTLVPMHNRSLPEKYGLEY